MGVERAYAKVCGPGAGRTMGAPWLTGPGFFGFHRYWQKSNHDSNLHNGTIEPLDSEIYIVFKI